MDGWWLEKGVLGLILNLSGSRASRELQDPSTMKERRVAARDCVQTLEVDVPTYVDDLRDAVSKDYAAWPTRLYPIGKDGRGMYAGGPGPF